MPAELVGAFAHAERLSRGDDKTGMGRWRLHPLAMQPLMSDLVDTRRI